MRVPEEEDRLLIGWPFTDRLPLGIGEVDGIAWAITHNNNSHMPHVNGYARIPWEGHPWSGLESYDDIQEAIDVHGGLTFGPSREFTMETLGPAYTRPAVTFRMVGGWIGFDTAHAWDYWSDDALAEVYVTREPLPDGSYLGLPLDSHALNWTSVKVATEAMSLARQIAAAGRRPS